VRQLLHVEESRSVVHGLEAKLAHQHLDGHLLVVTRRAPAQQGKVIAERLGQVALGTVRLDGHRVTAFRELLALLVHQHRQVGEYRQRHRRTALVQCLPQQDRLGGGRQQVLAADDVGDRHVPVVDDVRQDEKWLARGLDHHEVLERPPWKRHLSPDHVVDHGDPVVGYPEAQCERRAAVRTGQATLPAVPVVPRGGVAASPLLDVVPAAVAGVEVPAFPEGVDSRLVERRAFRLAVRALVGVHPEPAHCRQDPVHPLLAIALGVGVLDPKDEHSVLLAGEEPVEERGTGAPDVEVPRR
jgi:hypothetical protein